MTSKTKTSKQLRLSKETLRALSPTLLGGVRGGVDDNGGGDTHSDIIDELKKLLTVGGVSEVRCKA